MENVLQLEDSTVMVSVVIKESDLRRAGRGNQEVFGSNVELGLI